MNIRYNFFTFFCFAVSLFLIPQQAAAVLKIDITSGRVQPVPIAIPAFGSSDEQAKKTASDISAVIEKDLERSGLFAPIEANAFIQKIEGVETIPSFGDWRKINSQLLLIGSTKEIDGKIQLDFRLWDVLAEKQISGKSYTSPKSSWRRLAHMVADEVYSRLTGETGYFDTRIAYIAESGSWRRKTKRLAIMDQDGANHVYLTSGKNMVLTPRFDPNSQRIIYLAYYGKKPSVYLYNLANGKEDLLGNFPAMSFAPRFSPDGKKAIMSVSEDGNSEIYEMDIKTRNKKKLTDNYAIDTSPCYSPDARQIVFNSDRGGSQQLYVMDNDGGNVKRITFGDGNYATPVWSPRGDLIAFTRMYKGKFYIGVIRPDGSGERLLTESFLDEGPTWSPNGRVIIFTRQEESTDDKAGQSKIYSIDLTGYNERLIPTPADASDPAWSPLLSK